MIDIIARAQGARLGNRSNAAEAAVLGWKVQTAEAKAFAANVLPIIESLRASGIRDLRGPAAALNSRGVRTALRRQVARVERQERGRSAADFRRQSPFLVGKYRNEDCVCRDDGDQQRVGGKRQCTRLLI